jgi:hypothetical protein
MISLFLTPIEAKTHIILAQRSKENSANVE